MVHLPWLRACLFPQFLICNAFPIFVLVLAHDAVLVWAHGVNKTIEQGYLLNDGIRVVKNIFNSTFTGVTGNIVLDRNGDRQQNFKVNIIL